MDKKPTTQVARLRIDVRTPTRIVRRIVDVSMATQLPKVARILRAARGWTGNRGYTFEIDGRVYRGKAGQQQERETPLRPARERPAGPGGPGRRSLKGQLMADGLRLDDALGETRRFTFIQNVTARRSQVVEVETLGASNEPEEAFPRLVEAVGTLALSELTADDENRRYLIDAQSPRANEQAWAIEMCSDEARRAEVDSMAAESAIEMIRTGHPRPADRDRRVPTGWAGPWLGSKGQSEVKSYQRTATLPYANLPGERTPGEPRAWMRGQTAVLEDNPQTTLQREKAAELDTEGLAGSKARTRVKASSKLARLAPGDMAVLAVHGTALEEIGEWRAAMETYERAVMIGLKDLPPVFDGLVDKTTASGAGLIRAATGLGRCECNHVSAHRGIRWYERVLDWDATIDSEAALRLGSEYVQRGRLGLARPLLTERAPLWAPYDYDLTLCELLQGEETQAITAARRGLVTNPYIAERLFGVLAPLKIAMGETGRGRARSVAVEYTLRYGHRWHLTEGAVGMLRWVSTHPAALTERAQMRTLDYAAANERDTGRRTKLIDGLYLGLKSMEDGVSAKMLSGERSPHGTAPWKTSGLTPWKASG